MFGLTAPEGPRPATRNEPGDKSARQGKFSAAKDLTWPVVQLTQSPQVIAVHILVSGPLLQFLSAGDLLRTHSDCSSRLPTSSPYIVPTSALSTLAFYLVLLDFWLSSLEMSTFGTLT